MDDKTLELLERAVKALEDSVKGQAALVAVLGERIERQNWFIGAICSHTGLMMQMQALDSGREVVHFDPTDPKNEHTVPRPKDGDPVTLERITSYLPPKLRKGTEKVDFYELADEDGGKDKDDAVPPGGFVDYP